MKGCSTCCCRFAHSIKMIALQEEYSLLTFFFCTIFVNKLGIVCQDAELNSSSNEMDEVMRAVSAENERLLSATQSSQRRRRSSVSFCDAVQYDMLTFNVQFENWQTASLVFHMLWSESKLSSSNHSVLDMSLSIMLVLCSDFRISLAVPETCYPHFFVSVTFPTAVDPLSLQRQCCHHFFSTYI